MYNCVSFTLLYHLKQVHQILTCHYTLMCILTFSHFFLGDLGQNVLAVINPYLPLKLSDELKTMSITSNVLLASFVNVSYQLETSFISWMIESWFVKQIMKLPKLEVREFASGRLNLVMCCLCELVINLLNNKY